MQRAMSTATVFSLPVNASPGYAQAMEDTEMSLPRRGRIAAVLRRKAHASEPNIAAERLFSTNGLVSLIMLSWSVLVLIRPALLRNVIRECWRRWPWLAGARPPC